MGWGLDITMHLDCFRIGKPHTTDLEYQRSITKNHEGVRSHDA
jgi:hypothetical protein